MAAPQTKTVTELLPEAAQLRTQVGEILEDIDPKLANKSEELKSLFTAERASELIDRLTAIESSLSVNDDYETTLAKLQGQIDEAEKTRDQALAELFELIRPIEKSYRQIQLFFDNAKGDPKKPQNPIELHVYNTDPAAIEHGITLQAVENCIKNKNGDYNFKNDICNLVVPGYMPQALREKFEQIAYDWNALLIGDVKDHRSYQEVETQFRENGDYEYLVRPDEKAACDVVTVGYLKVRDSHWFEKKTAQADDLFVPASVSFAGAFVRADSTVGLSQGPIGTKFGEVKGAMKARFEPLMSQTAQLAVTRQLIPIIRDGSGHLCFYGCRSVAEDPQGVLKFFAAYRILRAIGKECSEYLTRVAGRRLDRDMVDAEIDRPITDVLKRHEAKKNISRFSLSIDRSEAKLAQGILDIKIEAVPVGMLEQVNLAIEVPEFKTDEGGK